MDPLYFVFELKFLFFLFTEAYLSNTMTQKSKKIKHLYNKFYLQSD